MFDPISDTRARRRAVRIALILTAVALTWSGTGWAQQNGQQESSQPSPSTGGFDFSNPLASQGMQQSDGPAFPQPIPMEGAVDPSEYRVGPGDMLTVSIGGPTPYQQTVPVSAEGRLVLPEVGGIPVNDRTLAEVQQLAIERLRNNFENVSVELTLAKPREFYVHVTGAVPSPGRYPTRPIERVHAVLGRALSSGGGGSAGRQLSQHYQPSLRSVRIVHADGTQDTVDLLNYFATGDKENNPYLRDGDLIYVDSYDSDRESVQISGEVAYPGVYQVLPDDSLLDVLLLAAGQQGLDHVERARLTRRTADSSSSRMIAVSELDGSDALPVEPRDVIRVPASNPNAGQAIVTGYIEHPGRYVVEEGETSLKDLVEMAGGFRPEAHLEGAVLTRSQSERAQRDPRTTNLDFMGRTFLQQSLQEEHRISVDVARVLDTATDSISIYDGDQLYVPRDENSVLVVGEVAQPGFVPYRSGRALEFYLREAGGTGSLATQAYVLKAEDGNWLEAGETEVASGDMIFVNREPTADTPQLQQIALAEKDTRIRTIQTILTGVSTITGIVTTFVALFGR